METIPYFDANLTFGRRATPRPENDLTTERILEELAHAGISGGLGTHALAREYDPHIGNERLTELTLEHPEIQACYVVQPHSAGRFPAGDALLEYLRNGVARAVQLFPQDHSFGLGELWAGPLLGTLEEAGIPVLMDIEQADLDAIAGVLAAHPKLKLILLRVGYRIDHWLYPLFEKYDGLAIELARYPVHRGIENIINRFGAKHMVFGTGLPVWDAGAAITHIQYARIDDADRLKIASGNLESMLWEETAPEKPAPVIQPTPRDSIWSCAREGKPFREVFVMDPHTHMGPYHNFHIAGDPWAGGMLEVMDETGIDCAVTAPMIALEGGIREGNQIAADAAAQYPGRYYAFCTINPNFPEREIREELTCCFEQDCFRGIKIHPATHNMPAGDKRYRPVWEIANEKELPILIHTWGTDSRCNPALFAPIAAEFPNAQLILGHAGATPDGIDEAIAVAHEAPNVTLDLTKSIIYRGMLEYMVRELGDDRIIFGTDLPFISGNGQLGRVAAARLPIESKEKILGLNARKLFRL